MTPVHKYLTMAEMNSFSSNQETMFLKRNQFEQQMFIESILYRGLWTTHEKQLWVATKITFLRSFWPKSVNIHKSGRLMCKTKTQNKIESCKINTRNLCRRYNTSWSLVLSTIICRHNNIYLITWEKERAYSGLG